jgi:hypothetical protein
MPTREREDGGTTPVRLVFKCLAISALLILLAHVIRSQGFGYSGRKGIRQLFKALSSAGVTSLWDSPRKRGG